MRFRNLMKTNYKNSLLVLSELISKSFSFVLFWILGIYLTRANFSEFIIEMPIIFLFSTVLSFGCPTYFLQQKNGHGGLNIENMKFSLSLVTAINIFIFLFFLFFYFIELLSFHYLLLIGVTISINLNTLLVEYLFVNKSIKLMVFINIFSKVAILTVLWVLFYFQLYRINYIYISIALINLMFIFVQINNFNFNFNFRYIINYFQFTGLLTFQAVLAFLSYICFRFFISQDNNGFLIEFSVLQTYLGFFSLLVSVSNRLIIHDLYDNLITNNFGNLLKKKILFSFRLFILMSFIYFHVVVYYLNHISLNINDNLLIEVFIMILASFFYYVSQFVSNILIYNRRFGFLLRLNLFSTLLSILLTYFCTKIKIDIAYPISLLIVNFFVFIFVLFNTKSFVWKDLIPFRYQIKIVLILILFLISQKILLVDKLFFYVINIFFLIFLLWYLIFNYIKNNRFII